MPRVVGGPRHATGRRNCCEYLKPDLLILDDMALSSTSPGTVLARMMAQRDDENRDLDIRARTLLVPPELQQTASVCGFRASYLATAILRARSK